MKKHYIVYGYFFNFRINKGSLSVGFPIKRGYKMTLEMFKIALWVTLWQAILGLGIGFIFLILFVVVWKRIKGKEDKNGND